MNLTNETVINRSREDVWRVFDDPESLKKWQPTLESLEHVSGEPGQVGAVSRLVYNEQGREVILVEEITERNKPDSFSSTYTTDGVTNTIHNRFVPMGEEQTRWIMETSFAYSGIMRVLGPLMKRTFVRQTEENMRRFKELVESS